MSENLKFLSEFEEWLEDVEKLKRFIKARQSLERKLERLEKPKAKAEKPEAEREVEVKTKTTKTVKTPKPVPLEDVGVLKKARASRLLRGPPPSTVKTEKKVKVPTLQGVREKEVPISKIKIPEEPMPKLGERPKEVEETKLVLAPPEKIKKLPKLIDLYEPPKVEPEVEPKPPSLTERLEKTVTVKETVKTARRGKVKVFKPIPMSKLWLRYRIVERKIKEPFETISKIIREKSVYETFEEPKEVVIRSPHLREELGLTSVPSYREEYEKLVSIPAVGWTKIRQVFEKKTLESKTPGEKALSALLASSSAFAQGLVEGITLFATPWRIVEGVKEVVTRPQEVFTTIVKRVSENPLEISRMAGQMVGAYLVGKLVSSTMPKLVRKVEFYPRETVRLVKLEPPDKVMYVKAKVGPFELIKPEAKTTSYPDVLGLKYAVEPVKPYPRYVTFIKKPLELLWKGEVKKPKAVYKTLGKIKYDVRAGETYGYVLGDVVKVEPSALKTVLKKVVSKVKPKLPAKLRESLDKFTETGKYVQYDVYFVKSPEFYSQVRSVLQDLLARGKAYPISESFKEVLPKGLSEAFTSTYVVSEEPTAFTLIKQLALKKGLTGTLKHEPLTTTVKLSPSLTGLTVSPVGLTAVLKESGKEKKETEEVKAKVYGLPHIAPVLKHEGKKKVKVKAEPYPMLVSVAKPAPLEEASELLKFKELLKSGVKFKLYETPTPLVEPMTAPILKHETATVLKESGLEETYAESSFSERESPTEAVETVEETTVTPYMLSYSPVEKRKLKTLSEPSLYGGKHWLKRAKLLKFRKLEPYMFEEIKL